MIFFLKPFVNLDNVLTLMIYILNGTVLYQTTYHHIQIWELDPKMLDINISNKNLGNNILN